MFDQKLLSVELVDTHPGPSSCLVAEWETFVAECPSVHLEQLWAWGEVRQVDGWRPALLVVRHERVIVAGALILVRRLKRLLKIGYVSRGPLVKRLSADAEASVGLCVANGLKEAACRLRIFYLAVDLPYRAGRLPEYLRSAGFFAHLPHLPPTGLMNGALLIDLKPSENDLMMGFRGTLRNNIRQAEKGGVIVREGDEGDIDLLWKLMNDLCRRRGTRPNVSKIDVMRRLWQALRPSNRVRIDVAEVSGKPVVVLMTVCLGSWAIPWRIGWAGDERRLNPEKFLYWSVLRTVRTRGCTVFDFNWIDTREVDAINAGSEIPASGNSGITFFKMGFGGEVVPLPGTMDFFPNPVLRAGMRRAGTYVLGSALVRNVLKRANRAA